MLAVAGSIVAHSLFLPPVWGQATSRIYRRLYSSRSGPLSLFICAVDEASDQAGAALVAALKQLSGRDVELHGVGGRLLADQGLQNVVSDEQLHSLTAAEIIPPAYKLLQPGSDGVNKGSYAKIFKDCIWEAALDGCRGRGPTTGQQQGSTQSPDGSSSGNGSGSASSSSDGRAAPGPTSPQHSTSQHVCYDAVLTINSTTAAQLTLNFLHQAQQMQKAKLPVVVQYMVPGLWNFQGTSAAAARWSKLVDHVMCTLPFEPALLHAAGVPSSFVGHPLLQQLLGTSTSINSFGGKARLLASLLKQQQQQQQQQRMKLGQQHLFASGDAAAFWRCYDATYAMQQQAAAEEAAEGASDSSSGGGGGSDVNRVRQAATRQQQQPSSQLPRKQHLLLALLPGTTEAEVISSMAAFDQITQQLQQSFPHLIATLHVPDVLVKSAVLATLNFKVPVLVVTADEKRAADALAAAAAAISHPGHASLQAVAAGLPVVCVRDGSMLTGAWNRWRQRHVLPYGSIPNLLLGRAAVPEVNLWEQGGVRAAVEAAQELLQAGSSAGGGSSSSSNGGYAQVVAEQKAALQEALLKLVPPLQLQQQQQQQQGSRVGGRAAAGPGVPSAPGKGWQLPAEAAARTLLELIDLRQQHEAELAAAGASSSTGAMVQSSGATQTGSSQTGQPFALEGSA